MYSAKVLEHLENPRHVGDMTDATARGDAVNPVCGDLLHLYLKIEDDRILRASYQVCGCPPSIAAGSVLTEMLTGLSLEAARQLTPQDITNALERLPRNKEHCSVLAIDALRAALEKSGEV
ncbi:MAG TPA: iron-sulfur cluster assembly scaffold protein [Blastocatellia bacterium]|nr:iron-sulfur cluster assembly scaffold protein [Blastocatellia bacterium]